MASDVRAAYNRAALESKAAEDIVVERRFQVAQDIERLEERIALLRQSEFQASETAEARKATALEIAQDTAFTLHMQLLEHRAQSARARVRLLRDTAMCERPTLLRAYAALAEQWGFANRYADAYAELD